ncbi:hypothetical protein ACFVH6_23835 [Spirillospora sp. NPDC127200]
MSRRKALTTGLTAVAVGATGLAGMAPARAAAGTAPAGAGKPPPPFPHVPGMRGDRRANELWYDYEIRFAHKITQEIRDAFQAMITAAGGSSDELLQHYARTRKEGTYPEAFMPYVTPARDAYAFVSRLQLELYDRYYRHNLHGLAWALIHMGEGTLYDPRMPHPNEIHMMNGGPNGEPTKGWHFWHAINRGMTLQNIDRERWSRVDRLMGAGWETQSILKPQLSRVNPPLDRRHGERLIRAWRRRTPDQVDAAFDSFPYPAWLS